MYNAGLLLGFGFILIGSAELVVRSASSLSKRLGITNFAVGFLLLGLLTSTPEIFVAIQSAIDGIAQLSVGNLLGGSILLLSFVIGLSSIILGRLTLDRGLDSREIAASSFIVASPVFVLWDGVLTRIEGAILIVIYFFHAFFLKNGNTHHKKHSKSSLLMLCLGLLGMVIASKVMIESAKVFIDAFHIPSFVFGLLLLSFGTNLPEFSLAFQGAVLKKEGVAFGDFLGSAAANTLILGFLGMFSPFEIMGIARVRFSLALLALLCVYFVWAASTKREISRTEGFGLLLFYLAFVAFELSLWV